MASKQKKSKKGTKRRPFAIEAKSSSTFSTIAAKKRARIGAPESVASAKGKKFGKGGNGGSLFETQWTKPKFDIMGKKRKNEGRHVGLSRSVAIDKRKKTILPEFKSRGKSNVFLDHRFGEKDEALAEEDKAILRFQRERQAQWQKRSKFTLPDEDEEAILTHGGTALLNLDDFGGNMFEDDDDDEELEKELVRDFHFGGDFANGSTRAGDDQNEKKPKSKKEVMEEIIAKSKFYKAQKAREKEEDAELKDQLDKEFSELAQSQALISLVRPRKSFSVKASIDAAEEGHSEKADDFDKLVKEMGMEMRAHASDRLKTDEEMAEEEKARLDKLEEKRRKRMLDEELSDDSGSEETERTQVSQKTKRQRLEISGDDLGENFLIDDDHPEKGWVDEVLARKENEEEDSTSGEEDENDENNSGGDSSGDDVDEGDDSFEEGSDNDDAWEKSDDDKQALSPHNIQEVMPAQVVRVKASNTEANSKAADDSKHLRSESELPFVIDAPKTLEDFKSLVDGRSISDLLVVIQRIRTCNSIRLAAENRRKMQVFYGILLQYFAAVGGGKAPAMNKLDALVKPLIEMSSDTPYFAAVCARARIIRMREQFIEKLRNTGVDGPWPSRRTLVLFRLWCMTFPSSDFRHVVLTPCTLLMAEYLIRCPVKSARDLAVGTFICALLLSIMRPARRLCPEAMCFLYAALVSALPKKMSSLKTGSFFGCGSFMLERVAYQPWLCLQNDCSTLSHIEDIDFDHVMTADTDASFFGSDKYRLSVLSCVLGALEGFSHIYEDISCYPELFDPFVTVLQVLAVNKRFPQAIHARLTQLLGHLKDTVRKTEKLRQPLRMRIKKPVPIKQFNPKFEEDFVLGRNYDPDRERAEAKKLQRLVRQEAKGAARELRKDNYFLQVEKAKEKALQEEQREEKYRKAMVFLQEQEAAFKSGQLGKGRGGRKR